MIKLQNLSLGLFFLLLIYACNEDEALGNSRSPLVDCCTTSGEFTVAGTDIFIPTFFTPDNDGINDRLDMFVNTSSSSITEISSFILQTSNGQTILGLNNTSLEAQFKLWDGRVQDTESLYTGKAFYTLTFALANGGFETITGEVCCLPCGNQDAVYPVFEAINNCQHGTQHNGMGNFGENLSSFEDFNCLEQ